MFPWLFPLRLVIHCNFVITMNIQFEIKKHKQLQLVSFSKPLKINSNGKNNGPCGIAFGVKI